MSSIYVLPFDPSAASQHPSAIANVSPAELWSITPSANAQKPASVGTAHIFYGTPSAHKTNMTVVTSLGEGFGKKTGDARKEVVRKAIGSAVKSIKKQGEGVKGRTIYVDASHDPHAACECNFVLYSARKVPERRTSIAVAAHLALYQFSLKTSEDAAASYSAAPSSTPQSQLSCKPIVSSTAWDEGAIYAYAQNLAKTVRDDDVFLLFATETATYVAHGAPRKYVDTYRKHVMASFTCISNSFSCDAQEFANRIKAEFAGLDAQVIVRDEGQSDFLHRCISIVSFFSLAWAAEKGMVRFV